MNDAKLKNENGQLFILIPGNQNWIPVSKTDPSVAVLKTDGSIQYRDFINLQNVTIPKNIVDGVR